MRNVSNNRENENVVEQLVPTIGLEVHIELKTHTKMFCDCLNDPHEKHPNINICSVCAGHPGTLPTINKTAVKHVLKMGYAIGGEVFPKGVSKFDRKNYFYPDLPKGFQISQYDQPLVEGGRVRDVDITRIHLEEDAGRLSHTKNETFVDFNRAGVPLMELVTEPVIRDAQHAGEFARLLRLMVRYLDISLADMDKGQMRLEANISLSRYTMNQKGERDREWGTKVEVKNINSFKALEDAINFELVRQRALLESGKKVIQETRGWNDIKKESFSQRSKEDAQEYRYFPEPDLPPMNIHSYSMDDIKASVPELPDAKQKRFEKEYKLTELQSSILVQDKDSANYFEEVASELEKSDYCQTLYNYFTSDFWGMMKKEGVEVRDANISPAHFAHLISIIESKKITSRIAKDLLYEMRVTGLDPHSIMENHEWESISSDVALRPLVEKMIADNSDIVEKYKKGNTNSIQFLIGKMMKELNGKADPALLRTIFEELLKN